MMDSNPLSQEDYILETEERLSRGLIPYPPRTLAQLDWLTDRSPELATPFLPRTEELKHIGRHRDYGRCRVIPEAWKERFLLALVEDPMFAVAIRVALQAEGRP